jgi:hypothetical protein
MFWVIVVLSCQLEEPFDCVELYRLSPKYKTEEACEDARMPLESKNDTYNLRTACARIEED